jgi:uncharacterized protein
MSFYNKYIKYKNKYINLKQTLQLNIHINSNLLYGGKKISDYKYLDDKIKKLEKIFQVNNISTCHGIEHAKAVLKHAINALESLTNTLSESDIKCILYASLLHDADDKKFFPLNTNYQNVRSILEHEPNDVIDNVIEMIELVSSSINGDKIPKKCKDKEWMLIPRYADRLEAIGMVGLVRTFIFTLKKGRELYLSTTPMPKIISEIWKVASIKRYKNYSGASVSMLDHFYDKLLRLGKFPITNKYLNNESKKRIKPLLDFLLFFNKSLGNNLSINNPKEEIKKYIKKKAPDLYKEYEIDAL